MVDTDNAADVSNELHIWLHRANVPERSEEAVLAMWSWDRADGIECDVRFTTDDVPVLHHNYVGDKTWAELQKKGVWRLEDALVWWSGRPGRTIMIEVKTFTDGSDSDQDGRRERILFDTIRSFQHRLDDIIIASFDEAFLSRWVLTRVMYLTCNRWVTPPKILESCLLLTHIGVSMDVASPTFIDTIRQIAPSIKAFVFTVSNATEHTYCVHTCRADGVITDWWETRA